MNERIEFIDHAVEQAELRGASRDEVREAIHSGEPVPAKKAAPDTGKTSLTGAIWKERYYETKQILAITVRENESLLVITVYAFYF